MQNSQENTSARVTLQNFKNTFFTEHLRWEFTKKVFEWLAATGKKMGKRDFYSDHSNSCFAEKILYWVIPCLIILVMSLLPHGFLEIFTKGRYHRDMKIQKILASNSKRFRVYGIFKRWEVDDDRGAARYNVFLDNFCLK